MEKKLAKYGRPEYESICAEYIASKDVSTQGTGLDIFAKGKYQSVRAAVEEIAKDADEDTTNADAANVDKTSAKTADKKQSQFTVKKLPNANAKKAKRILQQIDSFI